MKLGRIHHSACSRTLTQKVNVWGWWNLQFWFWIIFMALRAGNADTFLLDHLLALPPTSTECTLPIPSIFYWVNPYFTASGASGNNPRKKNISITLWHSGIIILILHNFGKCLHWPSCILVVEGVRIGRGLVWPRVKVCWDCQANVYWPMAFS